MTDLALPLQGSCRCGQVSLRISAQPIMTMACHCKGCQKMSASAFSLNAAIPEAGFQIVSGEPVIGGMKNPQLKHFFCPECMTWLFTRFMPDIVNVRPGLFGNPPQFSPFIETWTKTKLPWATTPAVHSYDEFPPPEDFGRLTAEFARR